MDQLSTHTPPSRPRYFRATPVVSFHQCHFFSEPAGVREPHLPYPPLLGIDQQGDATVTVPCARAVHPPPSLAS